MLNFTSFINPNSSDMKCIFGLLVLILLFINTSIAQTHRDSVDIHHYFLELDMTKSLNGSIKGKASLKLRLTCQTNSFQLDLYKLTTDSVIINNKKQPFSASDSTLRIFYAQSNSTDTLQVDIYYRGYPKTDAKWGGFFHDNEMAYNIGVGMGSYPHGIGRFWFPCNDAFTDRASYDFKILTRESEIGIASGLLLSDSAINNNHLYHWQLLHPIPTYLASIAVGDFIKISDTYQGIEKNIPIEIYCMSSDSAASVLTFSDLKANLAAFEKRFGAYRWDKIGYSVVSFNAGAMEHATNIAYPRDRLGDNIKAKTLVAHELAHHWFGNLVTCSHSSEMWLNEGWASYCESIFKEEVISHEAGMNHTLSNHYSVLKESHKKDGGYYALNKIPPNITYGSTVYDKGAVVTHCLRGYLGDELFFNGITEFLNQNNYQSINSEYLQKELSKITHVNLEDFFKNWVYQPGFPNYSISQFKVQENTNSYTAEVEMQQKLRARNYYGNSNKVPLSFLNDSHLSIDTIINFDGPKESIQLDLSFYPTAIFIDKYNTLLDASTSDIKTITKIGDETFTNCDFKVKTNAISDSALIQVQFNWVIADDFKTKQEGLVLTNYNYWRIDGIFPDSFNAKGIFTYNFSLYSIPESDHKTKSSDRIVLLYRKDSSKEWTVKSKGESAKIITGYLWANNLKAGDYALAYWDGKTPLE